MKLTECSKDHLETMIDKVLDNLCDIGEVQIFDTRGNTYMAKIYKITADSIRVDVILNKQKMASLS